MQLSLTQMLAPLWATLTLAPALAGGSTAQPPSPTPHHIHGASIPGRGAPAGVTAFVDVTVVPMDTERVLPHQTVLVTGGRITTIGPVARVAVPAGAVQIDGRGQFLIPGLADMHTHLVQGGPNMPTHVGSEDSVTIERALFLWLANGVTTIRNMDWSDRVDGAFLLRLRARAAAGEVASPRLYVAGPLGNFRGSFDQKVAAIKAAGYDFIKLYGDEMSTTDSVGAAARRVGLPIAGHVPPGDSGIERAIRVGYRSIEHLTGYRQFLTRGTANYRIYGDDGFTDTSRVMDSDSAFVAGLDASRFSAMATATQRAGVWNCPTNVVLLRARTQQWPELRYISDQTLASLNGGLASNYKPPKPYMTRRIIDALRAVGAGLLAGTDQPVADIDSDFWGMVPGFSLHHELETFVQLGLTPYQALLTSTRNVAAYFGTLQESGTVAVGKRADLVLLAGNPLVNIQNTQRITGVMRNGRWFARTELDKGLEGLVGKF